MDIWVTVNGGTPFQYADDAPLTANQVWVTELAGGTRRP